MIDWLAVFSGGSLVTRKMRGAQWRRTSEIVHLRQFCGHTDCLLCPELRRACMRPKPGETIQIATLCGLATPSCELELGWIGVVEDLLMREGRRRCRRCAAKARKAMGTA